MTGIEPGSSGIKSDRSANCATTTAPAFLLFIMHILLGTIIELQTLFTLFEIIVVRTLSSVFKVRK